MEVSSDEVKKLIRLNKVNITNLTLTSDNRLIDKHGKIRLIDKHGKIRFIDDMKNDKAIGRYMELLGMYKSGVPHTPNNNLTEEVKNQIRKFGLVHYTNIKNEASIRKSGLQTRMVTSFKGEEGRLWYFINNPDTIPLAENEILKKHSETRPVSDETMLMCIWHPTEEEMNRMLYRETGKGQNHIQIYQAIAVTSPDTVAPNRITFKKYKS